MISYRQAKEIVRGRSRLAESFVIDPWAFASVVMSSGTNSPPDPPFIIGAGWAKKHPLDEWDAELGATIARGRAEADIARQWMNRLKEEEGAKSKEGQGEEEVEGLSDGSAD